MLLLQILVPEHGGRLIIASDGVWDSLSAYQVRGGTTLTVGERQARERVVQVVHRSGSKAAAVGSAMGNFVGELFPRLL